MQCSHMLALSELRVIANTTPPTHKARETQLKNRCVCSMSTPPLEAAFGLLSCVIVDG